MPMPPPPPPGLPPPGPPPPPVFNLGKSKSGAGADNRGALLQSIRQGTKLKKAVTVDKSGPYIPGKATNNSNINNDSGRSKLNGSSPNNHPMPNGLPMGGLFAGGIPKLRSTGLRAGASQPSLSAINNESRKLSPEPQRQNAPSVNSCNLNEALKRQLASDIRNRGPPPQPPTTRNIPLSESAESSRPPSSKASPDYPVPNKSTLHRNIAGSTPFLHQPNGSTPTNQTQTRSTVNHGKPNVAPKPPPLLTMPAKPATPPKKIALNGRVPVSRAQSMRVPRSPPVASTPPSFQTTMTNGKDFGTIRGIPTAFHQSQENLTRSHQQTHSRNQTLPMNLNLKSAAPLPPAAGRPSGPPPSRPPVPPPPSRTGSNVNLKAPLSPPPPPPKSQPPPPPPHRTNLAPPPPPSHSRPPPAIPTNGPPPPPPVRNSSMRNGMTDLDTRFSNLFHPVSDFPAPSRFLGFTKVYNSKNAANKQQAPLPPNSVHLGNKLWESSTC